MPTRVNASIIIFEDGFGTKGFEPHGVNQEYLKEMATRSPWLDGLRKGFEAYFSELNFLSDCGPRL